MGRVKLRQEVQRAVTARFPLSDFAELSTEAEMQGTTIADMLRISWRSYCDQRQLDQVLFHMEARFVKVMFETCSAVAGLSDVERQEAQSELKERMEVIQK
jgi:hypothetical protein